MSDTVQAAVLGVVQGLTEFLPVSSTAHLILARAFFGWETDRFGLAFDVACHVGTLAAVVAFYWRDVVSLLMALPLALGLARAGARGPREAPGSPTRRPRWGGDSESSSAAARASGGGAPRAVEKAASARLIWLLVAGTIPAVVVGVLFGNAIEDHLRTVPLVAATLALVALGMVWAERAGAKARDERSLTVVEVLWIGCAQAAALVPGVSRSGATLVVALLVGLRRQEAARFIFLLSIPAILGAAAREAPKMAGAGLQGAGEILAVGVASSAIVGYLAVRYFIRYVANHSLHLFAWYRLALAVVAVGWLVL